MLYGYTYHIMSMKFRIIDRIIRNILNQFNYVLYLHEERNIFKTDDT
jgi:hypothetical protein